MKKRIIGWLKGGLLAAAAIVLSTVAVAWPQFAPTYSQRTISVTSSTVPTACIPTPGNFITFEVRNRAVTANNPIVAWFYTGTLPGAVPANVREINNSESWGDQFIPPTLPPTQQGIACALESGSTAQTVDSTWR